MTTTLSLPKLTDEYKRDQQERVLNAEVAYEWHCILKHPYKWAQNTFVFVVTSVMASYAAYNDPNLFLFGIAFVLTWVAISHFLFQADNEYQGQITPEGVIIRKTECVPEVFYAATRYLSYIGIVVCIIAGITLGPMIFAGAGAFALLAFKMTGFQKNAEVEITPFLSSVPYRLRLTDSCYGNGILQFYCQNRVLMEIEDDNAEELRNFHWVSFCSNEEQYIEIQKHLSQLITLQEE